MTRERKTQNAVIREFTVRLVIGDPSAAIPAESADADALMSKLGDGYQLVKSRTTVQRVPVSADPTP